MRSRKQVSFIHGELCGALASIDGCKHTSAGRKSERNEDEAKNAGCAAETSGGRDRTGDRLR